jgi:hypothetical protein
MGRVPAIKNLTADKGEYQQPLDLLPRHAGLPNWAPNTDLFHRNRLASMRDAPCGESHRQGALTPLTTHAVKLTVKRLLDINTG